MNWPECEADHSPSSTVEAKNVGAVLPQIIEERDSFTLLKIKLNIYLALPGVKTFVCN
jgi:hypothetical protein